MNSDIQKKLHSDEFQKFLMKNYIKSQLTSLIKVINGRYPEYFTNDNMITEIELMTKMIDKLDIKLIELVDNTGGNITSNTSDNINNRTKKIVNQSDRCSARVWDKNNIIWTLNNREVYGNQCKMAKSQNSKYCTKHNKKLTHGDWFSEPSELLKYHFNKHFNNHNT